MTSKQEFKAKLDGSFEDKLRAAYMAGFQDGQDDGLETATSNPAPPLRAWLEAQFQSWLKDPQAHTGVPMNEEQET